MTDPGLCLDDVLPRGFEIKIRRQLQACREPVNALCNIAWFAFEFSGDYFQLDISVQIDHERSDQKAKALQLIFLHFAGESIDQRRNNELGNF